MVKTPPSLPPSPFPCMFARGQASSHVDATVVTLYIPVQPVSTSLFAYWLLGDDLLSGTAAGGVLILAGVLAVLAAKRAEAAAGGAGPQMRRVVSVALSSLQARPLHA